MSHFLPEVTRLLADARAAGLALDERVLPLLYEELRALAARQISKERPGHTLAPTALVHEAWIKLHAQREAEFRDRGHFLAVAAMAMRRILVNHAEARAAAKRGGNLERVTLVEGPGAMGPDPLDLLALDQALTKLGAEDARKARVVELRFFAGLESREVAEALGVTERTVERDWRLARAWLRRELGRGTEADESAAR